MSYMIFILATVIFGVSLIVIVMFFAHRSRKRVEQRGFDPIVGGSGATWVEGKNPKE